LLAGWVLDRLLAIEVDGWAWHSDVDRFAHDRAGEMR
jgi:hypothetical protein